MTQTQIRSVIRRGLLSSLCLIMPLVVQATGINVNLSETERAKGSISPAGKTFDIQTGTMTFTAIPKTGYELVGWGVSIGESAVTINPANPNELTVTASASVLVVQMQPTFRASTYTLRFDANGGQTPNASQKVTYGTELAALPVPTREGHTFNGWFVGTRQILAGETVTFTANVTATANWTVNKYAFKLTITKGIKGVYYKLGEETTRYNSSSVSESVAYGTSYSWYAEPATGYTTTYTLENPKTGTIGAQETAFTVGAVAQKMTVYFDPGTGGTTPVASKSVTYDQPYGELPIPEKDGSHFEGWETPSRDRIDATTIVRLTADTTLTARWSAEKVQVVSSATNGRVSVSPTTVEFGKPVEIQWWPNSESGYDYAFAQAKVYAGSDATGICLETYTEGVGALFTLTKYYPTIAVVVEYTKSAKAYKVTFNGNEGTSSQEDAIVHYKEPFGTLPTATRTGYDFDGWSTLRSGSSRVTETDLYEWTYDRELYARWIAKTYAITTETTHCQLAVTTNGLETSMGAYDRPILISATPESRTGYDTRLTSVVVYSSASPGASPIKNISSPENFIMSGLQAYYEGIVIRAIATQTACTYTLSFDLNGGMGSAENRNVTYDGMYGDLPIVTRTGYDFVSWQLSDGTVVTPEDTVKITANAKLTAQWQAKTFNVSFDPQTKDVETPSAIAVTYDATYGTLPTLIRTGYTFNGWYDAKTEITAETTVKITSDQTLTAKWTANRYTILFNANGGSGTMTSVADCAYDEPVKLPLCAFRHKTHTFIGWATDPLAETPDYADGASVYGLTDESEISLYAVWLDTRNELSKAAHCVNCTVEGTGNIPFVPWYDPVSGQTAAQSGYRDLPFVSQEVSSSWMRLNLVGPGTFSFKWRVGEGDPICKISLYIDTKYMGTKEEYPAENWDENFNVVQEGLWFRVTCKLSESRSYAVDFESFARKEQGHGYILVDELTWTPNGTNPAPTEADRPVIGAGFSFMTDARFDYVIWTTESLVSPIEWKPGEPIQGTGEAVKLPGWLGVAAGGDALRYGDAPQRFYKVEVRQRK